MIVLSEKQAAKWREYMADHGCEMSESPDDCSSDLPCWVCGWCIEVFSEELLGEMEDLLGIELRCRVLEYDERDPDGRSPDYEPREVGSFVCKLDTWTDEYINDILEKDGKKRRVIRQRSPGMEAFHHWTSDGTHVVEDMTYSRNPDPSNEDVFIGLEYFNNDY